MTEPKPESAADTNDTGESEAPEPAEAHLKKKDPVRTWTRIIMLGSLGVIALYLFGDRYTPYSSQARVHALVVPIATEIPGVVTDILVENNELVDAGQVLFRINPANYELAVSNAEANLEAARQATGASTATVDAAEASVGSAKAGLLRAQQDATRLRRIKQQDPGAISDRRVEQAEASLSVAREQLAAAEANLEQAKQSLGTEGEENSRIQQAQAALDRARLDLQRTAVVAPDDGVVTDVRVDRGNFAGAGAPQMTFISSTSVWVQADLTENNLGHVDRGDPVELTFDVYPGRVYEGRVRATGFGVAVDSAPLGTLPTIDNNRQWLRDAQRFPVVVDFDMPLDDRRRLRVGAQASVIVYAGDSGLLNGLGRLYMRVSSYLSYAY